MESLTENNSTKHNLVSKTHLSIKEHVKQNYSSLMIHKIFGDSCYSVFNCKWKGDNEIQAKTTNNNYC